jgi:hypothetical protein
MAPVGTIDPSYCGTMTQEVRLAFFALTLKPPFGLPIILRRNGLTKHGSVRCRWSSIPTQAVLLAADNGIVPKRTLSLLRHPRPLAGSGGSMTARAGGESGQTARRYFFEV